MSENKDLYSVFTEVETEGANGTNQLGSVIVEELRTALLEMQRNRWNCPYALSPIQKQAVAAFAGTGSINFATKGAYCLSHPEIRTIQSWVIWIVAHRIKGLESVVVLGSTLEEALMLVRVAPNVKFRFIIGDFATKDADRISNGLAKAKTELAHLAKSGLTLNPGMPEFGVYHVCKDFLALFRRDDFGTAKDHLLTGKYFTVLRHPDDFLCCGVSGRVDTVLAFDCVYDMDPRRVAQFLGEIDCSSMYFTMHCAGELSRLDAVTNDALPYRWLVRDKLAHMVFDDQSAGYSHDLKNVLAWWSRPFAYPIGNPNRASTVDSLVLKRVFRWEPKFFRCGYGLFGGWLENVNSTVPSSPFLGVGGRIVFIPKVLPLLKHKVLELYPVSRPKLEVVRDFVLSIAGEITPAKIYQNIRSNKHRLVLGSRTLSTEWNLLGQDTVQILQFVILVTSLERQEVMECMVNVGKVIKDGGFEDPGLAFVAKLMYRVSKYAQQWGLIKQPLLEKLRKCLDADRPDVAVFELTAYTYKAPKVLEDYSPELIERYDLSVTDYDTFEEFKSQVCGYDRRIVEATTHGEAKLSYLVKRFDKGLPIAHFGVEPGGMLEHLINTKHYGIAFLLEKNLEGFKTMYRNADHFSTSFPVRSINDLSYLDPVVNTWLRRSKATTLAMAPYAIAEVPEFPQFLFDCSHCSDIDCPDELNIMLQCVLIVLEFLPSKVLLKCLSPFSNKLSNIMDLLVKFYNVEVLRTPYSSPLSYETYWYCELAPAYQPLIKNVVARRLKSSFEGVIAEVQNNWALLYEYNLLAVSSTASTSVPSSPSSGELSGLDSPPPSSPPSVYGTPLSHDSHGITSPAADSAVLPSGSLTPEIPLSSKKPDPPRPIKVEAPVVSEVSDIKADSKSIPPKVLPVIIDNTPDVIVPPFGAKHPVVKLPTPLQSSKTLDEVAKRLSSLPSDPDAPQRMPQVLIPDNEDIPDDVPTLVVNEKTPVQPKLPLQFWQEYFDWEEKDKSKPFFYVAPIDSDGRCFFKALCVFANLGTEKWRAMALSFEAWELKGTDAPVKHKYANDMPKFGAIFRYLTEFKIPFYVRHSNVIKHSSHSVSEFKRSGIHTALLVDVDNQHTDVVVTCKHPTIRRPVEISYERLIWHNYQFANMNAIANEARANRQATTSSMSSSKDPDIYVAHEAAVENLKKMKATTNKVEYAVVNAAPGAGKSVGASKMMEKRTWLYITGTRKNRDEMVAELSRMHKVSASQVDQDFHLKTWAMVFRDMGKLPNLSIRHVIVDECFRMPWFLVNTYIQCFPMARFIFLGDPHQMTVNPDWFPSAQNVITMNRIFGLAGININSPKDVIVSNVTRRFGPGTVLMVKGMMNKVKPGYQLYTSTTSESNIAYLGPEAPMPATYEDTLVMTVEKKGKLGVPDEIPSITTCAAQGSSVKTVYLLLKNQSVRNLLMYASTLLVALTRHKANLYFKMLKDIPKSTLDQFVPAPTLKDVKIGGQLHVWHAQHDLKRFEKFGIHHETIREAAFHRPINERPTEFKKDAVQLFPAVSTTKFCPADFQLWNINNPANVDTMVESMNFFTEKDYPMVVDMGKFNVNTMEGKFMSYATSGKRHLTRSHFQTLNTFMGRLSTTADVMQYQKKMYSKHKHIGRSRDLARKFDRVYIDKKKRNAIMDEYALDEIISASWNEFCAVAKMDQPQANLTVSKILFIIRGHLKQQTKPKGLDAAFANKGGQPVAAGEKAINIMWSLLIRIMRRIMQLSLKDEFLWANGFSDAEIAEWVKKQKAKFWWMGDYTEYDSTQSLFTQIYEMTLWKLVCPDEHSLESFFEFRAANKNLFTQFSRSDSSTGRLSGLPDTMDGNILLSMIVAVSMFDENDIVCGVWKGDDMSIGLNKSSFTLDTRFYDLIWKAPIKVQFKAEIMEFCNYIFGNTHYCYNPLILVQKIMNKSNYHEVTRTKAKWDEWMDAVRIVVNPFREEPYKAAELTAMWAEVPLEHAMNMWLTIDSYAQLRYHDIWRLELMDYSFEDVKIGGGLLLQTLPQHTMEYNYKNRLQELCQKNGKSLPVYKQESRMAAGVPQFKSRVLALGFSADSGWFTQKKPAEQDAARVLMEKICMKVSGEFYYDNTKQPPEGSTPLFTSEKSVPFKAVMSPQAQVDLANNAKVSMISAQETKQLLELQKANSELKALNSEQANTLSSISDIVTMALSNMPPPSLERSQLGLDPVIEVFKLIKSRVSKKGSIEYKSIDKPTLPIGWIYAKEFSLEDKNDIAHEWFEVNKQVSEKPFTWMCCKCQTLNRSKHSLTCVTCRTDVSGHTPLALVAYPMLGDEVYPMFGKETLPKGWLIKERYYRNYESDTAKQILEEYNMLTTSKKEYEWMCCRCYAHNTATFQMVCPNCLIDASNHQAVAKLKHEDGTELLLFGQDKLEKRKKPKQPTTPNKPQKPHKPSKPKQELGGRPNKGKSPRSELPIAITREVRDRPKRAMPMPKVVSENTAGKILASEIKSIMAFLTMPKESRNVKHAELYAHSKTADMNIMTERTVAFSPYATGVNLAQSEMFAMVSRNPFRSYVIYTGNNAAFQYQMYGNGLPDDALNVEPTATFECIPNGSYLSVPYALPLSGPKLHGNLWPAGQDAVLDPKPRFFWLDVNNIVSATTSGADVADEFTFSLDRWDAGNISLNSLTVDITGNDEGEITIDKSAYYCFKITKSVGTTFSISLNIKYGGNYDVFAHLMIKDMEKKILSLSALKVTALAMRYANTASPYSRQGKLARVQSPKNILWDAWAQTGGYDKVAAAQNSSWKDANEGSYKFMIPTAEADFDFQSDFLVMRGLLIDCFYPLRERSEYMITYLQITTTDGRDGQFEFVSAGEFTTDDLWFRTAKPRVSVEAWEAAVNMLSDCPTDYGNPTHWSEIWAQIKNYSGVAARMIKKYGPSLASGLEVLAM